MSTQFASTNQADVAPIIVDLGKARRKKIRRLKRGTGPLLEEVHQAVAMAKSRGGEELADKTCVPVVLIYRSKKKGRRWRRWGF